MGMFAGIVEGMAKVKSVSKSKRRADTTMRVQLGKLAHGLKVGDSVSINGVCLTVTKTSRGDAEFEMVAETIRRTSLGKLSPGDKVNIERSLRIGDRLEGHFVLGHVDGTGTIVDTIRRPSETKLWIKLDNNLTKTVVEKGSIAVDGVSLTLVDVESDKLSVSLVPHTLDVTILGSKSKGDKVNIEFDVLGKYVNNNLPKSKLQP